MFSQFKYSVLDNLSPPGDWGEWGWRQVEAYVQEHFKINLCKLIYSLVLLHRFSVFSHFLYAEAEFPNSHPVK